MKTFTVLYESRSGMELLSATVSACRFALSGRALIFFGESEEQVAVYADGCWVGVQPGVNPE